MLMKSTSIPQKFILECFQYSLTGRLGHGIVHNLNGPLQILSMQMEMVKMDIMKCMGILNGNSPDLKTGDAAGISPVCLNEISRINERMDQVSEVTGRLESMIQILGYRGEDEGGIKQPRPVEMLSFVNEFIEFWSADLYFKHRVEKRLSLPDNSVFLMMDESPVLAMMDGIMSGFLWCIKAREGSSFGMTLVPGVESGCRIEFEHTGLPVPDDICEKVTSLRSRYMEEREAALLGCSDIHASPELIMALLLGAVRSVDAGWSFELTPTRAVVSSS